MATCGVCGKNSVFPETYGSLTLCKKCGLKILSPTWKNSTYTTNEELERDRDSVLEMAKKAGFPDNAIKSLTDYFNSQIVEGLIKILEGGAGQNLAVLEDRFVIDTQDEFDHEEIEKAFRALMTPSLRGHGCREHNDGSGIDSEVLAGAARDMLTGFAVGGLGRGVMKAGANIAAGIATKKTNRGSELDIADVELRVSYGMKTYKYSDFEDVVLRLPIGEEDYGFLQFQRKDEPNPSKDVFFFFEESEQRERVLKRLHSFMQSTISDIADKRASKNREAKEAAEAKTREFEEAKEAALAQAIRSSQQATQLSAPEELMQWKQLLDAEAISQEEYDAKKAQLLGL